MTGLLLDCGPSPDGWSRWGPYSRCLKFGKLESEGLDDETEPRTRGILGHTGVGHLHTGQMLQQRNQPNPYAEPEAAMHLWCERNPQGREHLDRMTETYRRYVARFPEAPGRRILGVEHTLSGVLGTLDGQWGLWAVEGSNSTTHISGRRVDPATLNCPGHPAHGLPIRASRKLDLVFEDNNNRVYAADYKFKSTDVNDSAAYYSAMSGEHALARILSRQIWPKLVGLVLFLVQTKAPWKFHNPVVPESPWRDSLFPDQLHRLAHVVAQLERDELDPDRWPMAQNSDVCVGRHEKSGCPAMLRCMNGPVGWSP